MYIKFAIRLSKSVNSITHPIFKHCTSYMLKWWPPYWPTGRLADNQKLRNLTYNLSKTSNKTYSKAVIGQFKTLFLKRTNIPQFFQQLV